MTSETELIRLAQSGDSDAFCRLARRYERRIYSLALYYCRSTHDAEDLSQEAWLKAYRNIQSFRGEASFYTWLRQITINAFLNLVFSLGIGAIYVFLSESFPAPVRSSGLGLVYSLGVTIFGGTTQFVVAWLIDWTKNPMVPAWYQIAANVAAIVAVMLLAPHPGTVRHQPVGAAEA